MKFLAILSYLFPIGGVWALWAVIEFWTNFPSWAGTLAFMVACGVTAIAVFVISIIARF